MALSITYEKTIKIQLSENISPYELSFITKIAHGPGYNMHFQPL
jgi:hypothetical protein